MSSPPVPPSEDPRSPDLDFTATSLGHRKAVARDIVSSFDQDVLPSEFRPEIYSRITEGQSKRPSSEWTIVADLAGTVMAWTVHDPGCWAFMNRCRPANVRALLFTEKLWRRFQREFDRHDEMFHPAQHEPEEGSRSPAEAGSTIAEVAQNIHSLVAAARLDLDDRSSGPGGTAQVLLNVLEAICRTSNQLPRSASGTALDLSLFDILIRRTPGGPSVGILEALDRASARSPGILRAMSVQFETIGHILMSTTIPSDYWERFRQLSAQAGVTA